MRTISAAILAVLVLGFTLILGGCGGSSDQPLADKSASLYAMVTDLIAGGSAGADAGNNGWDAGDVEVSYTGAGLHVLVTLDTGVTFSDDDDVKLWASNAIPDHQDWIPGQMPYTLVISEDRTTAEGTFPGLYDNLYLMLHAVVCKEDGGEGTWTWTGWATLSGTGIIDIGNGLTEGSYDLNVVGDQLFICIHAPEGWSIGLVHFWFGGVDQDPPMNGQGKRQPGQYPYHYDAGMVQDYCIIFNLTDLGFTEGEEICNDFKGSLHAEFWQDGAEEHQTGWAEEPADWPKGSDFYFEVCTYNEYDGGGGEETCDTAWAYDNSAGDYPGPEDPDPELGYFEIFPWSDGGTVKRWGWVFYFPASPGTPWT